MSGLEINFPFGVVIMVKMQDNQWKNSTNVGGYGPRWDIISVETKLERANR